ncbi:MAG: hypothetical protein GWO16_00465 [Gammaproteobacteria bacterium]|nr:hypothetical protein [Gammaproteobacteria bacterium]NIR96598.1 hypothetical protein [Gammaproteobacteria bacterium]NIT62322.1 hypothetical protein [Gammaproteobacteria bacterium]NIV19245.1 hypothetical protein [Gammaproteobacteria bacterium]NIX10137.1 hypothetical protein [Gammaproteobacteria bacterium]
MAALTGHEPRPAAPPRGQGLISVAGGYDDNVTLASQADLVGVSEARDRFTELLAVGRYRLLGNAESGVRLDAALYARQYAEVNQFDQAALRLGLTRTGRGARWNTGLSGHVDRIQLDGEPFEDVVTLTATGARSVGARGELRLRYRVSRIEAVQDFEHLTGWRQRLRVEGRWDAAGYVKLGYELEWNDREDLRIGAEFFSQSPLRNRVYGEWRIPAEGEWQLSVGGEYRHSRYRDADVTASGIVTREDDKVELSLGAERALTRTVRLFGLYTYTDNDSELASFDYTRSEILGGIEWAF